MDVMLATVLVAEVLGCMVVVAGATVLVAEVLGCTVAVAEARLPESGRTDWIAR